MEKNNVRLKDIADQLGVSVSTVSRVLNNRDRVNSKTRERVLEALKEHHYIPNEIARSLKKNSTQAIGIIVDDISNRFFSKIIRGAEEEAYRRGYYTIVCNSDNQAQREKEYTQMLISQNISGLIVNTRRTDPETENMCRAAGVPIVFVDEQPNWDTQCSSVTINNYRTAYELTERLIKLGHKDIAVIGEENLYTTNKRIIGWRDVLKKAHITPKEEWCVRPTANSEDIEKKSQQLLSQGKRPTAILAVSNSNAYGVIRATRKLNISIPEDLSLICFDAEDEEGIMNPRLSGIIQPAEEMGRVAAQIILRMKEDNTYKQSEHIIMRVKEQKGESVCKFRRYVCNS